MLENTNKAIFVNTIISYARLIVTAIAGLFTTRFALQALGVDDFGLFSVIGGIIAFIAIINTIMLSTSNRFIAVAIGKGNEDEINEQFNVNLMIHVCIGLLIAVSAFPIGEWYIHRYIHYAGDIDTVVTVFNITIIGSIVSFIGVPYNGLLVAKERFFVFCGCDIIASLLRMGIAYAIVYWFDNKLLVYTIGITILSVLPYFVYIIYCHAVFGRLVKFRFIRKKEKYKEMLSFSVWIGYGALATVGKGQGAALIVNMFFTTAMNTALGIANSVNGILHNFGANVAKSISPQITKSYAAGNMERSEELVCLSSKISFLFMLLISSPFFVAAEYLLSLWLGSVPDNVVIFVILLIVDALIGSLNAGIPEIIFASGNIKWYQIIVNTLFLLSVVAAFFVLRAGAPAYYLVVTYIIFSLIVLVVRQVVLNRVVHFNNWVVLKKAYLPSLLVLILFLPQIFILRLFSFHPLIRISITICYLLLLIWGVGLNHSERGYLQRSIMGLFRRFRFFK